MSKIVERIKDYMDFRQISIAAFEKSIGLSNASFNKTLRTGGAIGTDKLEKILSAYPELNPHWLMTGEGPMVIPSGVYGRKISDTKRCWLKQQIEKLTYCGLSKADIARSLNILPQQLNNILNGIRGVSDNFLDTFITTFNLNQITLYSQLLPVPFALSTDRKVEIQDIPLYDLSATAGIMAIFNDLSITPEDYLRVPHLPPVDGAIYVSGESMTPFLKSGDIIIYKKLALSLDSILWGQIYLLSFDVGGDTFTVVKYIQKSDVPERIRLVSHNSHFEPKDIPFFSIRALAIVKASITFHTIE